MLRIGSILLVFVVFYGPHIAAEIQVVVDGQLDPDTEYYLDMDELKKQLNTTLATELRIRRYAAEKRRQLLDQEKIESERRIGKHIPYPYGLGKENWTVVDALETLVQKKVAIWAEMLDRRLPRKGRPRMLTPLREYDCKRKR